MGEAIFDKPLDKTVAALSDHIAKIKSYCLLTIRGSSTTQTTYNLSDSVENYLLISVRMYWDAKPIGEIIISGEHFVSTETIPLKNYNSTITFTIADRTSTSLKATSTNNAAQIAVYGIIKK